MVNSSFKRFLSKSFRTTVYLSVVLSMIQTPVAMACSFNCNKTKLTTGLIIEGQLSTELSLIKGDSAPTVILSHGGGGRWEHQTRWGRTLNDNGFNVVIIDHFTARGVEPYVGRVDPKTVPAERVKDLVAVASWISQQSWNKGKIGVIGFSQGGSGVNLLANTREVARIRDVDPSDLRLFGAVVSYYPGCGIAGGTPPDLPYLPAMVHLAMNDGLADPIWCTSGYRKNENLTIYKYDGAPHSFDVEVPGWKKTGVVPAVKRVWVAERHEPSNKLSRERTLAFLSQHLKN